MHFDMVLSLHASNWSMDMYMWICPSRKYVHAYTSKCKRNEFGPVWVHIVSIYTPDPSGKTNMAMEHPPGLNGKAHLCPTISMMLRVCIPSRIGPQNIQQLGVLKILLFSLHQQAPWICWIGNAYFHTSTSLYTNTKDQESAWSHFKISKKDQFLFVCCTLPETNSSPLKIGRAPPISHHFSGASCLFYRVLLPVKIPLGAPLWPSPGIMVG